MLSKLLTVRSKRFYKELYLSNLLSHRNVVSLVGVWSTEEHPFCVVYEYMSNLDLRQYLRNEPHARKLTLVFTPIVLQPINLLTLLGHS